MWLRCQICLSAVMSDAIMYRCEALRPFSRRHQQRWPEIWKNKESNKMQSYRNYTEATWHFRDHARQYQTQYSSSHS